jgi:hypothetical protein
MEVMAALWSKACGAAVKRVTAVVAPPDLLRNRGMQHTPLIEMTRGGTL